MAPAKNKNFMLSLSKHGAAAKRPAKQDGATAHPPALT